MKEIKKYRYIITSGWWCGQVESEIRKRQGSESIRELSFFDKWKKSVLENTTPQKIMVLDSASPIRPDPEQLKDIEFLSLLDNPGHSTNHNGRYSGYMRSIIMGVSYASLCDTDYWVYVEQDVLLKGKDIIEKCIANMTTPFMFGTGEGTPQFLQQSLVIIRKDGFDDFVKRLNNVKSRDAIIPPETKFLIASSKFYSCIPESFFIEIHKRSYIGRKFKKILAFLLKHHKGYDDLPVGYGRTRPIQFNDPFYYFQHGTEEELNNYFGKTDNT